jgi:hypothetical protein
MGFAVVETIEDKKSMGGAEFVEAYSAKVVI